MFFENIDTFPQILAKYTVNLFIFIPVKDIFLLIYNIFIERQIDINSLITELSNELKGSLIKFES